MKILIAYDGSPSADAAVAEVLRRPWPQGSEVRVVTVVEPQVPLTVAGAAELSIPVYERIRATLREEARGRLQAVVKRLQARPDLKVTGDLRDGEVKRALLDATAEWGADLVIAGSQGASVFARLFLGSVCHALVTHAPCSVEVIKMPAAA